MKCMGPESCMSCQLDSMAQLECMCMPLPSCIFHLRGATYHDIPIAYIAVYMGSLDLKHLPYDNGLLAWHTFDHLNSLGI